MPRWISLSFLALALLLVRALLLLALSSVAHAQEASSIWSLQDAWAEGAHDGTRILAGKLTLAADRQTGTCQVTLPPASPWDSLLFSLNPDPLAVGAEVHVSARLQVAGRWTAWLPLGVYGGAESLPRSQAHEPSEGVALLTDLLRCREGAATAGELRVKLTRKGEAAAPRLRRLAVSRWLRSRPRPVAPALRSPAWGRVLKLPRRSQKTEDAKIAGRVCSPTSLGMVLAYWGHELPTAQVAAEVFDRGADIYGNWSFNTAFAGELGLCAIAAHLDNMGELEAEIAAGRPVVISHRFEEGELSDSPVRATVGHLIVVVGFTATGEVVVHDPAADPRQGQAIHRVYKRSELSKTWLENAEGVAYLLRPES